MAVRWGLTNIFTLCASLFVCLCEIDNLNETILFLFFFFKWKIEEKKRTTTITTTTANIAINFIVVLVNHYYKYDYKLVMQYERLLRLVFHFQYLYSLLYYMIKPLITLSIFLVVCFNLYHCLTFVSANLFYGEKNETHSIN